MRPLHQVLDSYGVTDYEVIQDFHEPLVTVRLRAEPSPELKLELERNVPAIYRLEIKVND